MSLSCIIFDLDGTLANSSEDIVNCVHWTLRDVGLASPSKEAILHHVGKGVRPLIEATVRQQGGTFSQEILDIFDHHYSRHLLDSTRLYPFVIDVLEAYRSRAMAVVTNKSQKYTNPILEGLGIAKYFKAVVGRDACKERKPHPEPVLLALRSCGVEPSQAVMVGDTEIDVEAGRRAGTKTCAVLYGFGEEKKICDAKPDWIVSSAKNLLKLF